MKDTQIITVAGLVDLIFGLLWGDEGKGKAIQALVKKYWASARYQGGPNAGHTLYILVGAILRKFVAHVLPSGVAIASVQRLLIGNDVVMSPVKFLAEVTEAESLGMEVKNRLRISRYAGLIAPHHQILDRAFEWYKAKLNDDDSKIGTTGSGIGNVYGDIASRNALKIGMVLEDDFEQKFKTFISLQHLFLSAFITEGFPFKGTDYEKLNDDTTAFWNACQTIRKEFQIVDMFDEVRSILASGKNILAEGAQGAMLDNTFGDYPYVTSSVTTPHGLFHGLGIGPENFGTAIGVLKPYVTKVGGGPFPSRMPRNIEELFILAGEEKGATTGRERMCGWFDMVALQYVLKLCNGFGKIKIFLTKTDILPKEVVDFYAVTHYGYTDGTVSKKLKFPLSNVDPTKNVLEKISRWEMPTGVNDFDKIPLSFHVFVNYIRNGVLNLNADVAYIGTGPGVDDYCEYET